MPETDFLAPSRRGMRLLLGLLAGLAVAWAGWHAWPGGAERLGRWVDARRPATLPRDVVLPGGDPAAIGRAHGQTLAAPLRALERRYVQTLLQNADPAAAQAVVARANDLFAGIDPRWAAEIEALSEAAGVPAGAMKLANAFLDLGLAGAACRQVLTAPPLDGHPRKSVLHAHNLDWNNLGGVGHESVVVFRTAAGPDRFATVRVGFPGMVGALDIVNSEGVALSFNQMGLGNALVRMPVFVAMRDIAETCGRFEDAEARILNMPEGMPFFIGLSDARAGRVAVYERQRNGTVSKREPLDGLITADNGSQIHRAITDSRLDQIARAALRPQSPPDTIAAVTGILRHPEVLLDSNLYSVIFDYRNNKLYLASGRIPAAKGEYRVMPLFL